MRRPQFSLRFLIIGVAVCAVILMSWRNRPSRSIGIEVKTDGTTIVNGNEMELTSLSDALERELFVRRLWFVEPVFVLRADASVSLQTVTEAVQIAQLAGAETVTFASSE